MSLRVCAFMKAIYLQSCDLSEHLTPFEHTTIGIVILRNGNGH